MKVLPIGDARRRLPELVRKVAAGHAPITIGLRGRPQAVLASPAAVRTDATRRPLVGLVTLVGSADALDREGTRLRGELEASLDRTARSIEEARARTRPPR
ncbi:MAG: type II toxin-antitoxin system Phd/YefM family antitoxin [Myxococcota bacterium]